VSTVSPVAGLTIAAPGQHHRANFTDASASTSGPAPHQRHRHGRSTQLSATAPVGRGRRRHHRGHPGGTSATTSADRFSYEARHGQRHQPGGGLPAGAPRSSSPAPASPGQRVDFGTTAATNFTVGSPLGHRRLAARARDGRRHRHHPVGASATSAQTSSPTSRTYHQLGRPVAACPPGDLGDHHRHRVR